MQNDEVRIQPAESDAELQAWIDVMGRVFVWGAPSLDELRHFRSAHGRRDLLAYRDGVPVGAGSLWIPTGAEEEPLAAAGIWVLPQHRRRGVGTALLGAIGDHALRLGKQGLEMEAYDNEPESLGFLQHRGYQEIERNQECALDLTGIAPPEPAPPPGIRIVTRAEHPDLAPAMYEVAREAVPDIPGVEGRSAGTFEEWRAITVDHPARPAELCLLALAGEEVVGYAVLQQGPPGILFHSLTGVKRAWRGRGIASALKRAQLSLAKRKGARLLVTENVEGNAPIHHLNERFNYKPLPSSIVFRGSIR